MTILQPPASSGIGYTSPVVPTAGGFNCCGIRCRTIADEAPSFVGNLFSMLCGSKSAMIVGADPDKGLHCDLEKLERCKSLIDVKWRTSSRSPFSDRGEVTSLSGQ